MNTSSSSKVEKKANKFRQKITQSSEAHQTYTPCMFTRDVEIESAETNIEVVRGQPLDWMNRIRQHGGSVVYNMLDELHKVESHSVRGPTAAFGAVIALAVTIATQGTGAGLLGTTGFISSAMANAGFSSLCSQAALSLANNNGDIGRAAESLANTDTLKSLGVEVALAGLTGGGAKPDTFIGHFAEAAHKASYRMLVEKVVYGKTDEKGVALNALSSAVGASISTEIGAAHYNGEIQGLAHKALHGISGSIQGLIVRGEKGIAAGALGALVAETVADVMTPTGGLGKVSASKRPNYSADQIRLTQNVARLTVGVAALLAGMDEKGIAVAISTATTAVENNFAKSAERAGLETVEEEGEDEERDTKEGFDTDDEAEETTLGKARKAYTDPLKEAAETVGLDKAAQIGSEYAHSFAGGEAGYVDAKLAEAERFSGRPLTSAEHTLLSESFTESYRDASTAFHMMEGAGVTTQIPGKCVDWFLRYTGLTDKGTARAAGHMVNDAFAAAGVGATVKGAAKGLKGFGKGTKFRTNLSPETEGNIKLISPPKMVKHHLFNKFRGQSAKSQKYRDFFQKHNIKVDDFAVEIPESTHIKEIHSAQRNWTTQWKIWIDANSEATTKEVYQFAGRMMDEYGISHVPIIPYK